MCSAVKWKSKQDKKLRSFHLTQVLNKCPELGKKDGETLPKTGRSITPTVEGGGGGGGEEVI